MLPQQRGEVRVGHAIAACRNGVGDVPIQIPESVALGKHPDMRQADERLNVPRSLAVQRSGVIINVMSDNR